MIDTFYGIESIKGFKQREKIAVNKRIATIPNKVEAIR